MTLHAHGAIWKESLNRQQENLVSISERSGDLTTIYCPKEVALMHCKGHSRDESKVAKHNQLADCQARKAVLY